MYATNPSSWNKWRSWFVESDVTVWSDASDEQLNPTSLVFNWKAKFILLCMLINNKKETSPQQSSVRSQHTPRLNQERCRPERARSRKVLVQSQNSHFTFGSMSMCLKKFCNMYLWYFVWSYQFFCQKLLVVALRVIFRDADVLVHVERLHVLEAHFSSLVRLRETCDDGKMIILIAHLDQFLIHPKRSSSCIKGIMSTWTSLVLMSLFSK